jgi:hypothetical protein
MMRITEVLSDYHTSPEEERKVERLSKTVERDDVREILMDFFMTTYDLIRRNSRAQISLHNGGCSGHSFDASRAI